MIKRFVPYILCFSILLSFLFIYPVNVSASENSDLRCIDVLDYGFPIGFSSNVVGAAGGTLTCNFRLPAPVSIYYYDIIFRISSTNNFSSPLSSVTSVSSVIASRKSLLTIKEIEPGLYRAYGDIDFHGAASVNGIEFKSSISNFYVSIDSFNVYTVQSKGVADLGQLYTIQDYDLPLKWKTMDSVGQRLATNLYPWLETPGYSDYSVEYSSVNWRNFDFIDFEIYQRVATIQTITCFIRNSSDQAIYHYVPFEFSFVNGGAIGPNTYVESGKYVTQFEGSAAQSDFVLNLRLYIPSEFRNDGSLIINITGLYGKQLTTNLVAIDHVTGYLNVHDYDPSLYKLDLIREAIEDSLGSSSDQNSAARDFKDQITSDSSTISQNQEILNNVNKPSASDLGSIAGADVILDSDGMGLLVQSFLPLTHSDIVLSILTLAATLALVGYVFFGKKK